ncbi:MAG: hypothetical protein ACYCVD_05150 [Desulfitobacteriaceae bacterium]
MIEYATYPPLPATPFSFSILMDSPIRCNLPFSPVSALIFPLAKTNLYFASLIVVGLDILMTFLFKRSYVHPPLPRVPFPEQPLTLTLPQLTQLMHAVANGRAPFTPGSPPGFGSNPLGQGQGPVGYDEPLFPDNLSFSLIVSAPFAPFDGSPDTTFNVPLFEIPGVPGNLVVALGLLIAQFLIERSGVGTSGCQPNGNGNENGNGSANGNGYRNDPTNRY